MFQLKSRLARGFATGLLRLSRTILLAVIAVTMLLVNVPSGRNTHSDVQAAKDTSCLLSWRSVHSPERFWYDGAAVSQSDVWVVGNAILHWDGATWNLVEDLYLNNDALLDISVVSANDIWAAGRDSDGYSNHTLVMRWDGTVWNVVPTPDIGTAFGVAAISPTSVWVVGDFNETPTSLHWNGNDWQIVPMPFSEPRARRGFVRGISPLAEDDIWAVGGFEGFSSALSDVLVWHWNGTEWEHMSAAMGHYAEFSAVSAVTPNDVWAVGKIAPYDALVAHWDGAQWTRIHNNQTGMFNDVSGISADTVWAVGWAEEQGKYQPLIEYWAGNEWKRINQPVQPKSSSLWSIFVVPPADMWAVGTSVWRTDLPCVLRKPNSPQLLSPYDGESRSKTKVSLRWNSVKNAAWYSVTIKMGEKVVDQQWNLTTNKYRTVALRRGKIYKWRVKACNSMGCQSSEAREFTILK